MASNPGIGFGTPFEEQLAFFRAKLNLPSERWDDISRSAHDRAFIVAGAMKADLVNDFRQAIDKAMAQGTGLAEFQRDFKQIVAQHGWTGWTGEGSKLGEAWRTKVIYQTNMSTSYAAGRWQQLNHPDLLAVRPYWKYIHADGLLHPRPLHQAWNGIVLPHDHPFWQTHFAPNGWGCRCRIMAVDAAAYAAAQALGKGQPPEGWDSLNPKTGAPVGIDKGFDYAPGASVNRPLQQFVDEKLLKLSPELAAAMRTELAPTMKAMNRPWSVFYSKDEIAWHDASFKDAPDWMKQAVAKRGELQGSVQKGIPEYSPTKDLIRTDRDINSLNGQSVWRHEYGHALDVKNGMLSAREDYTAAMKADAQKLMADAGVGATEKAQARALVLKSRYEVAHNELVATTDHAAGEVLLEAKAREAGIAYQDLKKSMETHTDFPHSASLGDVQARYMRIITAYKERDAQRLVDAMMGYKKGPNKYPDFDVTRKKSIVPNVSDFFGSVTKNKVSGMGSGFGHLDSYYRQRGAWAEAETFANLTDVYSSGDTFLIGLVERLSPKLTAKYLELMMGI